MVSDPAFGDTVADAFPATEADAKSEDEVVAPGGGPRRLASPRL